MATLTVTSTADSGAGSFRQAIADAASGDTIVFDSTTFPANIQTTVYLSTSFTFSKILTIDGGETWEENGVLKTRVVLDAQSASRIYLTDALDKNATLKGLTFKNGVFGTGGAVFVRGTGTITLEKCVFDSCVASTTHGGAIASNAYPINISDCYFVSCTAQGNGGGIASSSTSGTILNCVFKNCSANNYGGAIYASGSSQITLTGCVFIPPENNTKTTIYNAGTNADGSLIINGSNSCDIATFAANSTTVINGKLTADVLTINNGSSVTFSGVDSVLAVTTTATIGSATFTAAENSTGYAAFPVNANISAATFGDGVTSCVYGADVQTFTASPKGAEWTASNLQTPILIELKNGDAWETVTKDATGGSYETSFADGATVRSFDGERFILATTSTDAVVSVFGSDWSDVARYALGIKTNPDTPL